MRRTRRLVVSAACAVLLAGVAGCGAGGFSGIYDLPLPGGADLGNHPYQVTARFSNVLNLVPQAAVRVHHVAVGKVDAVTLPKGGWTARVTMTINGHVRLPANATATLAQSSLLGEKYVELAAPKNEKPRGRLRAGAVIKESSTDRYPAVEEVLGALSLLLNGGGVEQLHTITTELNRTLGGNEPEIRHMLKRLDTFISNLDAHRKDITDALDGLDELSGTLAQRDEQIGQILDTLEPGMKVLDRQHDDLVRMLKKLDSLSTVAVNVVERSKDDVVADLRALAPILRQLANAGADLPNSLEVLLTYPYTDAVLPAIKGDYLNTYLSLVAKPGTTVIPPLIPGDESPGGGGSGDAGALSKLLPGLTTPPGSASSTPGRSPRAPGDGMSPGDSSPPVYGPPTTGVTVSPSPPTGTSGGPPGGSSGSPSTVPGSGGGS